MKMFNHRNSFFSASFLILCFLAFNACKKDPELAKSKKALLIAEPWMMVDYKVNNIRFYGILTDCQKDNIRKFMADGTYSLEEGPSKCDANDPQIIQQDSYTFVKDETAIRWRRKDHAIVRLTETELELTFYDHRDFYELSFKHP